MKLSPKLNLAILTLALMLRAIFPVNSIPSTTVYIDPETYEVHGVGQTFTINISVAEVTNLWGWEFKLFYNSAHLNCTSVGEGPFLKTAGETFFYLVNMTDNYDATHGYIHTFCILTHVIPGASGNGVIANVTFKSKAPGSSILHITGTKLKNSEGEYMPHEALDGTIIVLGKLGDLDDDGDVDGFDLRIFCKAYNEYKPCADFDDDGDVDGYDLRRFCKYYSEDP